MPRLARRTIVSGLTLVVTGALGVALPAPRLTAASLVRGTAPRAPLAQTAAPPTQVTRSGVAPASPCRVVLDRYCVTCHNERLLTAGLTLDLDTLDVNQVSTGKLDVLSDV